MDAPIVVSENLLRKLIRKKLLEGSHWDEEGFTQDDLEILKGEMGDEHYDPFLGDELDRLGYSDTGFPAPEQAAQSSYYATSLKDVADEMGFSRESGAKGLQDRAMAKFKIMWENKEAFKALRSFSIESYINLMEMFELLDPQEADYFRSSKEPMAANDSWRIFHSLAFVEPLQRKIKKDPSLVADLVNVASSYYTSLPFSRKEEILDKALEAALDPESSRR